MENKNQPIQINDNQQTSQGSSNVTTVSNGSSIQSSFSALRAANNPHTNNVPILGTNEETDVIGIISIVFFFVFAPLGLILGLVRAHNAKTENRSPVLSRIGWIICSCLSFVYP
jgi:hypothetical protein